MTQPPPVSSVTAKSILTPTSGFASAFDYSLNPYSGCTFGCQYCYAAFFTPSHDLQKHWGDWVRIKENALDLLQKHRDRRPLDGATIYMSTVTDPYQPIERELKLTRSLLQELSDHHDVRLMVQTRAPLVTRDIDLLRRFEFVQVNMTVTTDDETVRKAFEPSCPSIQQRLDAIATVASAEIPTTITMTPLLPVSDPESFAERLLATGADRFVVQGFHVGKARFAAGTGEEARRVAAEMGWDDSRYRAVRDVLRANLPDLREGKDGFTPWWLRQIA